MACGVVSMRPMVTARGENPPSDGMVCVMWMDERGGSFSGSREVLAVECFIPEHQGASGGINALVYLQTKTGVDGEERWQIIAAARSFQGVQSFYS